MHANLNDASLKKHLRTIAPGENLFQQGDQGNSLFIVVQGALTLHHRAHHYERTVGTLGPGEVLGEKALFRDGPYTRSFTARAKIETTLLEFDTKSFKLLTAKFPDFHMRILKQMSERLDEANERIGILLVPDGEERLTRYLLHFCHYHYKKVPQGLEIGMTAEDIRQATSLEEGFVQKFLEALLARKVLVSKEQGYVLADEEALRASLSDMKARHAA